MPRRRTFVPDKRTDEEKIDDVARKYSEMYDFDFEAASWILEYIEKLEYFSSPEYVKSLFSEEGPRKKKNLRAGYLWAIKSSKSEFLRMSIDLLGYGGIYEDFVRNLKLYVYGLNWLNPDPDKDHIEEEIEADFLLDHYRS